MQLNFCDNLVKNSRQKVKNCETKLKLSDKVKIMQKNCQNLEIESWNVVIKTFKTWEKKGKLCNKSKFQDKLKFGVYKM